MVGHGICDEFRVKEAAKNDEDYDSRNAGRGDGCYEFYGSMHLS